MVLHVLKWDIHPDKIEEYTAWAKTAVPRLLAVPGLAEFRAYRIAIGSSKIVTTYEFVDFEAWTTWFANEEVQKMVNERRELTINETSELWGPSPVVTDPIRPGN